MTVASTMDGVPELLPCPFCGERQRDVHLAGSAWFIGGEHTDDCHFSDFQRTSADAIAAWNRRATRPPAGPDVEERISDAMIEASAKAIYDHWQNAPGPHARTWALCIEKLPGQARDFRAKAKAGLVAALSAPSPDRKEEIRREAGDGRRSMDSAPKDGTHILARDTSDDLQPPTTVHWFDGGWHLSVNAIGMYSDHGCADLDQWMPLPVDRARQRAGKSGGGDSRDEQLEILRSAIATTLAGLRQRGMDHRDNPIRWLEEAIVADRGLRPQERNGDAL